MKSAYDDEDLRCLDGTIVFVGCSLQQRKSVLAVERVTNGKGSDFVLFRLRNHGVNVALTAIRISGAVDFVK